MPSSSKSKSQSARRPVLRFELEQVRLGERPNAYKKPQLVLKPQLELPAREIYTGVQPRRIPIWHHYLMVHVKDKADELVKIDLNDFSQPSNMSVAPVSQHSVFAFLSELSVVFEYPDGMRNATATLKVTFKNPSDFEAVLSELRKLDIRVTYDQPTQQLFASSNYSASRPPPISERSHVDYSRQMYNISPPLTVSTSSQDQYTSNSDYVPSGYIPARPAIQPALLSTRYPWPPITTSSPSSATIGRPSILGQPGLYKISRVSSTSSSRSRARKASAPPSLQRSQSYAVPSHLDRAMGRRSMILPRRPTNVAALNPIDHLSARVDEMERRLQPQNETMSLPLQRFSRTSSLGGALNRTRGLTMQTLDPIHDESDVSPSLNELAGDTTRHASYQSESITNNMAIIGKNFGELDHRQPEPDRPMIQQPNTLQLLQLSQIQHEGFLEASNVWNEFMEMAEKETKLIDNLEERLRILSKLEPEFRRNWDRVVSSTVRNMKDMQGHCTMPNL
ncbi:hypothetical protein QBC42DRAFT_287139 [Cladorrhinum samala]|uniref:Uncharacterized protein n=1 Tax=Cladorrhinum samala TaxID=585594 RepID=A0AAV9HQU1_9PEZI|nr:hypothetical protein QBC42DRAFT_287139 [Cladorrhinum samala]